MGSDMSPLPPLRKDSDFVRAHDPSFFKKGYLGRNPAGVSLLETSLGPLPLTVSNDMAASNAAMVDANPWAGSGNAGLSNQISDSQTTGVQGEDDFYS